MMNKPFFRKSVLAAVTFLFCLGLTLPALAAETPILKALREAKAVEAFVQGGKFNFRVTQADGSSSETMKSFADFGVGNISTVKYAAKAAPAWKGSNFSVTVEETGIKGENVTIVISGSVSSDGATLVNAAVKKTIKDARGNVTSAEWTLKNITGGTLKTDSYAKKRKVVFSKIKIPMKDVKNHLQDVKISETSAFGRVTTFVSVPTPEQMQKAFGSSPYFDSYNEVALSVTFILDL